MDYKYYSKPGRTTEKLQWPLASLFSDNGEPKIWSRWAWVLTNRLLLYAATDNRIVFSCSLFIVIFIGCKSCLPYSHLWSRVKEPLITWKTFTRGAYCCSAEWKPQITWIFPHAVTEPQLRPNILTSFPKSEQHDGSVSLGWPNISMNTCGHRICHLCLSIEF